MSVKRLFACLACLTVVPGVLAAPTPLPPAIGKMTLVKNTKPAEREIRPGVTYHRIDVMHFPEEGHPLSVHFLVIDWTKVDKAFTLAVVPGKDGNRSRPSDLAKGTNAIAAVNGVFHQMTDPYVPFYARKIDGVVSKSQHAGGDGCLAFNRGEMPYIGRFSKDVFAKYENVISADGVPDPDPNEAKLSPEKRQARRAPRTFAGNDTRRKLTVIAVADGRQRRSVGLTYGETRKLLEAWGCDRMTHLDGGGSSVMILRGNEDIPCTLTNGPCRIMNVPSDGLPLKPTERRVAESLMLLD